ncbi:hypothetical protein [Paracoccus yeei]|uniref:hypothetical protein n=1 Tax=Paracoccus yeei TaxID=147645 RepID=UPI003BF7C0C8
MGGSGSGRRWHFGSKDPTESYRSIDVRWLKREGMLTPGAPRHITWSRHGKIFASINIRAELGRVILAYRHRSGGGEWKDESYPVHLTTTPCHIGGERHWFLCPARGCGQRIAVIYGGSIFACRKCHQLAYPSQREDIADRAGRRADRIRSRLGWPAGVLNGSDFGKPKGMHWRTYQRLCREHDVFSDRTLKAIADQLNLWPHRTKIG